MLKKLDLYIIKKYLGSFLFTMVLITMVSIVVNFSEKIHKFIDAELSTLDVIKDYYIPFIPWINGLMWPLFSLIAVVFFTSRMAKNTEVVAMLSSGMSFNRFLVPYLIGGGLIAGVFWVGKNYLIPYSNKLKNEFEYEYLTKKHKTTLNNNVHFFLNEDEKVYIRYYRKRDTTAQGFRLEQFQDGKLAMTLKADRLLFKEEPNKWTIKDYDIRTFDGMDETFLDAHGESKDTTLNLTPNDFIQNMKIMENMNTSDLRTYVEREKERGVGASKNFLIELHRRNSEPFSIIILTLIGAAISSRKVRGGLGLHLAIGIIIGATFVIISQFSATFSNNLSLSPFLGAWLPNLIFSLVAIYLIMKSQK